MKRDYFAQQLALARISFDHPFGILEQLAQPLSIATEKEIVDQFSFRAQTLLSVHFRGCFSFLLEHVDEFVSCRQLDLLVAQSSEFLVDVSCHAVRHIPSTCATILILIMRKVKVLPCPDAFPMLLHHFFAFSLLDVIKVLLDGISSIPTVPIDIVVDGRVKKGELRIQSVSLEDLS